MALGIFQIGIQDRPSNRNTALGRALRGVRQGVRQASRFVLAIERRWRSPYPPPLPRWRERRGKPRAALRLVPQQNRCRQTRGGKVAHVDMFIDAVITAWLLSGLVFGIMTVAFFTIAFIMRFI